MNNTIYILITTVIIIYLTVYSTICSSKEAFTNDHSNTNFTYSMKIFISDKKTDVKPSVHLSRTDKTPKNITEHEWANKHIMKHERAIKHAEILKYTEILKHQQVLIREESLKHIQALENKETQIHEDMYRAARNTVKAKADAKAAEAKAVADAKAAAKAKALANAETNTELKKIKEALAEAAEAKAEAAAKVAAEDKANAEALAKVENKVKAETKEIAAAKAAAKAKVKAIEAKSKATEAKIKSIEKAHAKAEAIAEATSKAKALAEAKKQLQYYKQAEYKREQKHEKYEKALYKQKLAEAIADVKAKTAAAAKAKIETETKTKDAAEAKAAAAKAEAELSKANAKKEEEATRAKAAKKLREALAAEAKAAKAKAEKVAEHQRELRHHLYEQEQTKLQQARISANREIEKLKNKLKTTKAAAATATTAEKIEAEKTAARLQHELLAANAAATTAADQQRELRHRLYERYEHERVTATAAESKLRSKESELESVKHELSLEQSKLRKTAEIATEAATMLCPSAFPYPAIDDESLLGACFHSKENMKNDGIRGKANRGTWCVVKDSPAWNNNFGDYLGGSGGAFKKLFGFPCNEIEKDAPVVKVTPGTSNSSRAILLDLYKQGVFHGKTQGDQFVVMGFNEAFTAKMVTDNSVAMFVPWGNEEGALEQNGAIYTFDELEHACDSQHHCKPDWRCDNGTCYQQMWLLKPSVFRGGASVLKPNTRLERWQIDAQFEENLGSNMIHKQFLQAVNEIAPKMKTNYVLVKINSGGGNSNGSTLKITRINNYTFRAELGGRHFTTHICPPKFPYPVEKGEYVNAGLCYNKEQYARQGWGAPHSWCAQNPEDPSIKNQIGVDGISCADADKPQYHVTGPSGGGLPVLPHDNAGAFEFFTTLGASMTTSVEGKQAVKHGSVSANTEMTTNLTLSITGNDDNNKLVIYKCTIKDFPLKKWTNLLISCEEHTLNIYSNGKHIKQCIIPDNITIDPESNILVTPTGGYITHITDVQFWDSVLTPKDVDSIYHRITHTTKKFFADKLGIILSVFDDNKNIGNVRIRI